MEDGGSEQAALNIETLPGGREHPIYKFAGTGELDNTLGVPPQSAVAYPGRRIA